MINKENAQDQKTEIDNSGKSSESGFLKENNKCNEKK